LRRPDSTDLPVGTAHRALVYAALAAEDERITMQIAPSTDTLLHSLAIEMDNRIRAVVGPAHWMSWDPGAEHAGQAPDYDIPETITCNACNFHYGPDTNSACERARVNHVNEVVKQARAFVFEVISKR
jgi:hypothetical protein